MNQKDIENPSNTDSKTDIQKQTDIAKKQEISTEQMPLTDEEILETLKAAHKTMQSQKDDLLKRKISQTIEHKLSQLKTETDSSKILPERIIRK